MTACSPDASYSLSSIDATIGVEADDLDIPQNSTAKIILSDILDLNSEDNAINMDADGNYVFERAGQTVSTTHCKVNPFTLTKRMGKGYNVDLVLPSVSASSSRKVGAEKVISASGKLQDFSYSTTLPADVDEVESVKTDAKLKLNIYYPTGLADVVSTIDYINVSLPSFITYANVTCTSNATFKDNVITIKNIPSNEALSLEVDITDINLTEKDSKNGSVILDGKKITVNCDVMVEMLASNPNMEKIDGLKGKALKSELQLSDVPVKSAVGKFSPKLDAVNIGRLVNSGLPSFMTNGNVVADFDNIFIYVMIDSSLPVDGFVTGSLTGIKKNVTIAKVDVPEFRVKANGTTLICICRKATEEMKAKYQCIETPNISEILKAVPDIVDFKGTGRADNTTTTAIEVGQEYDISSSYYVNTNVAFGEEAVLVFEKNFNGMASGMERFDLGKDSKITITAQAVNTIPLYCTAKAYLTDRSGKVINDIEIKSEEVLIPASVDGKTPASAQIKIEIVDGAANAIKKVDGLKFSLTGKSKADGQKAVTGVTLNGKTQYVEFTDVNVNINGMLIYNANKD
ncbi:MAG: hypothetical protein MJZ32_08680 [Bacteroidaceae bacterium]|nr:hypothetical protein [Bacteroidaceae bacterium]